MTLIIIKLVGEIIIRVISLFSKMESRREGRQEKELSRERKMPGANQNTILTEDIYESEEEKMSDSSNTTGLVILSFIVGGMVGGALGVLFAPKSGKETREDITRTVDDVRDKTEDIVQDARTKIDGFVEEARHKIAGDEDATAKTDDAPEIPQS